MIVEASLCPIMFGQRHVMRVLTALGGNSGEQIMKETLITRRTTLKGLAAGTSLILSPAVLRPALAHTGKITLGAPFHRTGIGASYGRWYERTAKAALKLVNEQGGINGHEVEMIVEDDGT